MKEGKLRKISKYAISILCTLIGVIFLCNVIDNVRNYIKSSSEYKIVVNNEDFLYYSLNISDEEVLVVSPEDYVINNVMEGSQIKNAYICESIKSLLEVLILLIIVEFCSRRIDTLLNKEPEENYTKFFKRISILCFAYLLVPSIIWLVLRLILTNDLFISDISCSTLFILVLGSINLIAYQIHKKRLNK